LPDRHNYSNSLIIILCMLFAFVANKLHH